MSGIASSLLLVILGAIACVLSGILGGYLIGKRSIKARIAAAYYRGRASKDRERFELVNGLNSEVESLRQGILQSIKTYRGIVGIISAQTLNDPKFNLPELEDLSSAVEFLEVPLDDESGLEQERTGNQRIVDKRAVNQTLAEEIAVERFHVESDKLGLEGDDHPVDGEIWGESELGEKS